MRTHHFSALRVSAIAMSLLGIALIGTAYGAMPSKPPANPEIDPTSMAGALTLLVSAGMLLTDKLRRKAKKA